LILAIGGASGHVREREALHHPGHQVDNVGNYLLSGMYGSVPLAGLVRCLCLGLVSAGCFGLVEGLVEAGEVGVASFVWFGGGDTNTDGYWWEFGVGVVVLDGDKIEDGLADLLRVRCVAVWEDHEEFFAAPSDEVIG
jgi:hypothetical protein